MSRMTPPKGTGAPVREVLPDTTVKDVLVSLHSKIAFATSLSVYTVINACSVTGEAVRPSNNFQNHSPAHGDRLPSIFQ